VELGLVLVVAALIIAIGLAIVGVGYLAVRSHFHEIPMSHRNAVAISSLVAVSLLAAWQVLAIFGLALGQSLGNGNLGSLIGGVLGAACWVATTVVYGSRMTRRLAELQVMIRASPQSPAADRWRARLRVGLGAIFLVVVVFIAGAAFAALRRTSP
jgi:hypothetical protein